MKPIKPVDLAVCDLELACRMWRNSSPIDPCNAARLRDIEAKAADALEAIRAYHGGAFRVLVSEAVPKDEVWVFGADGERTVFKLAEE